METLPPTFTYGLFDVARAAGATWGHAKDANACRRAVRTYSKAPQLLQIYMTYIT